MTLWYLERFTSSPIRHASRVRTPRILCGFFREISLLLHCQCDKGSRYLRPHLVKVETSVSMLISRKATRCALLPNDSLVRLWLETQRYLVRILARLEVCHRGCAYTVFQTVQRSGVCSDVCGTTCDAILPWKRRKAIITHSPHIPVFWTVWIIVYSKRRWETFGPPGYKLCAPNEKQNPV